MTDTTTHDVMVAQTAKAQELLDYFHGQRDVQEAQFAAALAAFPNINRTFYVDQAAGNDANDGSEANPFLTLQ